MIFNVLIIVMLFLVVYFHYLQGVFSALLSAILALFAAMLAFSITGPIVTSVSAGAIPEFIFSIALVAIYAVTYFVLRLGFDAFVPGNVRVPVIADKIGAVVFGVVAGLVTTGVIAIAGQMLPFSASIGFFARHEVADTEVTVPPFGSIRRGTDANLYGSLRSDRPNPEDGAGLWVPADAFVAELIAQQSAAGAFAGGTPFKLVHPNLLNELFMARLGPSGTKAAALNIGKRNDISIAQAFAFEGQTRQASTEQWWNRAFSENIPTASEPTGRFLVLRVKIDINATDNDKMFRFAPAQARLVVDGVNYYPVGTMLPDGTTLLRHRLDDFVFVDLSDPNTQGIDLVFDVSNQAFASAGEQTLRFKNPAFFEMKRLARVNLNEQSIAVGKPSADPNGANFSPLVPSPVLERMATTN